VARRVPAGNLSAGIQRNNMHPHPGTFCASVHSASLVICAIAYVFILRELHAEFAQVLILLVLADEANKCFSCGLGFG
jgi:hypothetical protein